MFWIENQADRSKNHSIYGFSRQLSNLVENISHNTHLVKDAKIATNSDSEKVEIKDFEVNELAAFNRIWEVYFGENGCLMPFSQLEQDEAKKRLVTAFVLSHYGHQEVIRGTGEAYIYHPLFIAEWLATKYRMSPETIAAALCHDLPEDSTKINKQTGKLHEFPVSFLTIKELLGEKIARTVDTVTQVRKTQKLTNGEGELDVTDRDETIIKILRAIVDNPQAIIIKIVDRLHNMRTIEGKPLADRYNIAVDTYEIYIPMALMMGMKEEAHELANLCIAVIDEAAHKDGLVLRITKERQVFAGLLDIKEITAYAKERLIILPYLGVEKVELEIPETHEIIDALGERRTINKSEYFLNMTVVIKDEQFHEWDAFLSEGSSKDKNRGLYLRAMNLITTLGISNRFTAPIDKITGIIDVLRLHSLGRKPSLVFNLALRQNNALVPVRVRVISTSEYDIETTPLTFLDAYNSFFEADQKTENLGFYAHREYAIRRHLDLKERFQDLDNPDIDPRQIIESVINTLPGDNIYVYGAKGEGELEIRRTPIAYEATILDYALLHIPNSWQRITEVYINGVFADFATQLEEGDKVHFVFGSKVDNHASVELFRKVNVRKTAAFQKIATMLREKTNTLTGVEKENFVESIRKYGMQEFYRHFPEIKYFGVIYAQSEFPEPEMSADDFYYEVGLHSYNYEQLKPIIEKLNQYWQSLVVVSVEAANVPNALGQIATIFGVRGINIIAEEIINPSGDLASLVFRFDRRDKNFIKYFNEAIKKIEKKRFSVKIENL